MNTELWLGLLAIIATVVGALAYVSKRNADSRLEDERRQRIQAETESMKAQAETEQVKAEAAIKIEQAKSDIEERTFMREQLKSQLALNEQFQKTLVEKEKRDESNYRVISNVQKDTNVALSNLHNAINRQNLAMVNLRTETLAALNAGRGDQSRFFAELQTFMQSIILDFGQVVSKAMESNRAERDLFPFPNAEDPAWETLLIEPILNDVTIHRQPGYADDVKLLKPCAKIAPHGERMKVIRGRLREWLIVDKTELGERCWGWIPTYSVRIVEPQIEPC